MLPFVDLIKILSYTNLVTVPCLMHVKSSLCASYLYCGHALAQLVEVLRYKSEGRGFDS
jgi:hypothetical protein